MALVPAVSVAITLARSSNAGTAVLRTPAGVQIRTEIPGGSPFPAGSPLPSRPGTNPDRDRHTEIIPANAHVAVRIEPRD